MADVLILGGGVIGMMTARELAQAGVDVTLVERTACAQESSWAGGGIVSPLYPWRYFDPVTRLATWSQTSYIHLAQELLEETGCDPELRQKGMFMVSVSDQAEALRWAEEYHRPLQQVSADFLYSKEPNLCEGLEQALWMPEVASIRNPRLGQALRRSLELNPRITLLENHEVVEFARSGSRVTGVKTRNAELSADQVILASGAWAGQLLEQFGVALPVEPVKGQMMVFNAPVGLIDRVVLMDGRYLIPRNDGRILIGSTLERAGFDKEVTDEARESLRQSAIDICPALAEVPVEYHWAGLRPGSPDGVPFIGQLPGVENLYVNAGHFRNGLVLAPASTRLLADLLLERQPIIDPSLYQLEGRIEQL